MEELKKIFKTQKEFQLNFYNPDFMTPQDKIALSKEYILCAIKELCEVLDSLPWKTHRRYDDLHVDLEEFGTEAIDVFKYLLNLFIIWGMSEEEFVKLFDKKSKIVQQRVESEKLK